MRIDLPILNEAKNFAITVDGRGFHVFHRTAKNMDPDDIKKNISSIVKSGFKPGDGDLHGRGMYTTLNLESQFDAYMQGYGNAIIEYFVPKKGFIIFDYNIAKLVYPGDYSLVQQLLVNKVYQNKEVIPQGLKVLSEDLFNTLKDPFLSADRSVNIWRGCYDAKGKPDTPSDIASYLKTPVTGRKGEDLREWYELCTEKETKRMSLNPNIQGIVYTGQNDGNCLVMYRPSPNVAKPMRWCVPSDSNTASNATSGNIDFEIPWTNILGSSNAKEDNTFLAGFLERGITKSSHTFSNVKNYDPNGEWTLDTLLKKAPWISNNGSVYQDLYIQITKEKKIGIAAGIWKNGTLTSDYFGVIPSDNPKPPDLNSFETKEAVFTSGIFSGGEFANALFVGGKFEKGVFNGFWIGGIWIYGSKAVWGKEGRFMSKDDVVKKMPSLAKINFESNIMYNGKVYPLDRPVPDWVAAFKQGAFDKNKNGKVTVDEPIELITDNIRKMCKIKPQPVIDIHYQKNKPQNTAEIVKLFQKTHAWFFTNSVHFAKPCHIIMNYEDRSIDLDVGMMVGGNAFFDLYNENAIFAGGRIMGKNFFAGRMEGGIYEEGKFAGTFAGGTIILDKTEFNTGVTCDARSRNEMFVKNKGLLITFKPAWAKIMKIGPSQLLISLKKNYTATMDKIQQTTKKLNKLGVV